MPKNVSPRLHLGLCFKSPHLGRTLKQTANIPRKDGESSCSSSCAASGHPLAFLRTCFSQIPLVAFRPKVFPSVTPKKPLLYVQRIKGSAVAEHPRNWQSTFVGFTTSWFLSLDAIFLQAYLGKHVQNSTQFLQKSLSPEV